MNIKIINMAMRWQENVEQTLTGKKNCIRCITESVSPI
jgi:hypothetical protein